MHRGSDEVVKLCGGGGRPGGKVSPAAPPVTLGVSETMAHRNAAPGRLPNPVGLTRGEVEPFTAEWPRPAPNAAKGKAEQPSRAAPADRPSHTVKRQNAHYTNRRGHCRNDLRGCRSNLAAKTQESLRLGTRSPAGGKLRQPGWGGHQPRYWAHSWHSWWPSCCHLPDHHSVTITRHQRCVRVACPCRGRRRQAKQSPISQAALATSALLAGRSYGTTTSMSTVVIVARLERGCVELPGSPCGDRCHMAF
jgi:hypothetical protein